MKEALIVLDAQKIYTDKESELYCKEAGKTIDNINSLIQQMTNRGQLIILVRHIHRRDGSDLLEDCSITQVRRRKILISRRGLKKSTLIKGLYDQLMLLN